MFVKTSAPTDWNLGLDEPAVQQVKVSSRGLVGEDRRNFLKRASASVADSFKDAEFRPGEVPVHLIALGATEFYNGNRNGDGFKVATCRQHHPTFVKYGKWFRHHKNTPTSDSYGRIVKSAFNEEMNRVELLCGLNGTKEAASANKGYLADEELNMLESGKAIPVSMACKIAYDVCVACGNKARTRNEYCGDACPGGGCKNNLGKLVKIGNDMQLLHVDNPNPVWFDISRVSRPADRIAYGGGLNTKTAAFRENSRAVMFVPLHAVTAATDSTAGEANKAVAKLAACLAAIEPEDAQAAKFARAFRSDDSFLKTANRDVSVLSALADRNVILSLKQFALFTNREKLACDAAPLLQDAFLDVAHTGRPTFAWASLPSSYGQEAARFASMAADKWSLSLSGVAKRAAVDTIQNEVPPTVVKQAACPLWSKEAAALADDYVGYKLAAFSTISKQTNDLYLTACLSSVQNQVI